MKEEIRIRFDDDDIPNHALKEALIHARFRNEDTILFGRVFKMKLHVGKRIKSVEIKVIPLEDRVKETFVKRIINFWKL